MLDERRLQLYRLGRIQAELRQRGAGALLTFDPVNTRYATGMRNMQVWSFHSLIRACFVPVEGRAVLFEYGGSEHLANALPTVAEVRQSLPLHFGPGVAAAERDRRLRWWCRQITSLMSEAGCGDAPLALDNQVPWFMGEALGAQGVRLVGGYEILAHAQAIKSDELRAMRASLAVAQAGMARLREAIRPRVSENELWAILNQCNVEHGGEYMDTRLLSAGPRTNPWYQEAGDYRLGSGDLVALDTDMIGPYGYDADISRTFIGGDGSTASPRQREAYRVAWDQLQHNLALLRPGVSFRWLSENAFAVPAAYAEQSIAMNWHGVGMYGGWPTILGRGLFDDTSEDGELVAGMTLCVEAYAGRKGADCGVKLEEQVLVTESGYRLLSDFPFEQTLLQREI